jgi:hypothetical protein
MSAIALTLEERAKPASRRMAAAMPALAKTEIAATRDLMVWAGSFMGGGFSSPSRNIKAPIGFVNSTCELF